MSRYGSARDLAVLRRVERALDVVDAGADLDAAFQVGRIGDAGERWQRTQREVDLGGNVRDIDSCAFASGTPDRARLDRRDRAACASDRHWTPPREPAARFRPRGRRRVGAAVPYDDTRATGDAGPNLCACLASPHPPSPASRLRVRPSTVTLLPPGAGIDRGVQQQQPRPFPPTTDPARRRRCRAQRSRPAADPSRTTRRRDRRRPSASSAADGTRRFGPARGTAGRS